MAQVSAELVLDLSQALAEIDTLQSDIDAATSNVDLTINVESSVDDVQAEIDSLEADAIEVEVSADVEAVAADIESLDTEVPPIDVPVDAPGVDETTAQIEDLGGASESAGTQIDGMSTATASFGAVAGAAGGSAEGLLGVLGGLGPAGAGAAAALGAVAVTTGSLFTAAVESVGSTQRFTQVLGEFASQVDSVELGGLTLSLEEFATSIGADDEALRNAATSIFAFGESAGASGQQVAGFTEQVILLAARGTLINPSLGEAGEAATRLQTALARGGRAASRFGIDLSSTEIVARALRDTGKESADELTQFERSAAGAAIATEQLGSSLQRDIIAGSENVQVKLASLQQSFQNALETIGEPLILPVFDLLQAGIPVALGVAEAFGAIGRALVPLASGYLDAIGPGVEIIAAAFTDFAVALEDIDLQPVFDAFSGLAVTQAETFAAALEVLAAVLPLINFDAVILGLEAFTLAANSAPLQLLAEVIGSDLPKATTGAVGGLETLTEAEQEAQAATEAFVQAAVGALPTAAAAFDAVNSAGEAFGIIDAASDPAILAANLQARTDAILSFQANLAVLRDTGEDLDATLQFIAEAGPEEGASLLENLVAGTAEDRAELETSLEGLEGATTGFETFLREEGFASGIGLGEAASEGISAAAGGVTSTSNEVGAQAGQALDAGLAVSVTLVQVQMGLITATVAAGGPQLAATAGTVGRTAGLALSQGFLSSAPALIGLALSSVSIRISSGSFAVANSARSAGVGIGRALGQGIEQGIREQTAEIANEARAAVLDAADAARAAAQVSSPSRLFAKIGSQMGEGLAIGFADAASALVSEAEAVTFAAAQPATVGAGGATANFGGVNVQVRVDNATPEGAQAVGRAVRDGVGEALEMQRQAFDVRVGI